MELVDRVYQAAKELGIDLSIAELAERLMHDKRPRLEDAYLFGQTVDNERSSFEGARRMQQKSLAQTFWIINRAAAHGFPGYEAWHERLGSIVGYENIMPLPVPDSVQRRFGLNVNTFSESQSLVALAKTKSKPLWYVVSPSFHLLRAFMTVASEALRTDEKIGVYGHPGVTLPWNETVVHSQGTLVATRAKLLAVHEMQRIKDYSKTDILPPRDIIGYMDKRVLPN